MAEVIYLDHCSTTPVSNKSLTSMLPYFSEVYGNASVFHHEVGLRAHEAVEKSRGDLAALFHAKVSSIIFTSGATEANNLIILGFALRHQAQAHRIIVTAVEHKSALEAAKLAERTLKSKVTTVAVDKHGALNLAELENLLRLEQTLPTLVAIMHTNNEIPVRYPIEKISTLCKTYSAFLHCDAVQGFVREPISISKLGASSVVLSAHKVYGPKGMGVLLLTDDIRQLPWVSLSVGGGHENNRRAGTQNVPAIVGGTVAFIEHEKERKAFLNHIEHCQTAFVTALEAYEKNWHFVVPPSFEVPGILSLYFEHINAMALMEAMPNICINRGAACTGGGEHFSHVPQALGLPVEIAANVIRISFGMASNPTQCANAARELYQVARRLGK